jgi:hypothetical protein
MMGRRSDIHWSEVEVDYRLGLLPVREIARRHGISDSNLRVRAKKLGWTRTDGENARLAAKEAMTRVGVDQAKKIGARIGAEQARRYNDVFNDTVIQTTLVVGEHRMMIRRAMSAALLLLKDLEESIIASEQNILPPSEQIRRCRVQVELLDKWASSFSKLSAAEREAHGIDEEKRSSIDDLLIKISKTAVGRSKSTELSACLVDPLH